MQCGCVYPGESGPQYDACTGGFTGCDGCDGCEHCVSAENAPTEEDGPPPCVATCDWSTGCPADCDTSTCPADGLPNKAEIDAYLAGGCDEGGGDDTCTTEDFHVLVSHPLGERASEEEQGAMMEQLSAGCLPCMMAAGGGNEQGVILVARTVMCFPAGDTTCTAEDLPIVVSTPPSCSHLRLRLRLRLRSTSASPAPRSRPSPA